MTRSRRRSRSNHRSCSRCTPAGKWSAAAAIAAAVGLVIAGTGIGSHHESTPTFEGKVNHPYYDTTHTLTVCYGETPAYPGSGVFE